MLEKVMNVLKNPKVITTVSTVVGGALGTVIALALIGNNEDSIALDDESTDSDALTSE